MIRETVVYINHLSEYDLDEAFSIAKKQLNISQEEPEVNFEDVRNLVIDILFHRKT